VKRKLLIGGGVLVVLVAIASLAAKPAPTPAATQGPGLTSAPAGATIAPPATQAAAVTLVDEQGSGIKKTKEFTATDAWTLSYSYDCSGFGSQGNFIVSVADHSGTPVDLPVNELGAKGSSSSQVYSTGVLHLEVNSECSWHLVATQP
jgi:hypothetical protein